MVACCRSGMVELVLRLSCLWMKSVLNKIGQLTKQRNPAVVFDATVGFSFWWDQALLLTRS